MLSFFSFHFVSLVFDLIVVVYRIFEFECVGGANVSFCYKRAGENRYYIFSKGTYKVGRKGTLRCAKCFFFL